MTRNGFFSRLGFVFSKASADDLNAMVRGATIDPQPDPSGAIFKNDLSAALNGLTPLASADWQGTTATVHADAGPPQSASGNGASRMVQDYYSPAQQSKLVADYQRLSDELTETRNAVKGLIASHGEAIKALNAAIARTGKLEKACGQLSKAIVAIAKGERFPESEAHVGEKAEDTEEEEREDDSAAQKGEIPVIDMKGLIAAVSGRADRANRVNPPPSFVKAGTPDAGLPDIGDMTDSAGAGIEIATFRQRKALAAMGKIDRDFLDRMNLSDDARLALRASGELVA